jgi:hypothetical protein
MVGEREYIASFQQAGAIYEESIVLLSEYARDGDWDALKNRVFRENLLKKNSSKWVEKILRTVRRAR